MSLRFKQLTRSFAEGRTYNLKNGARLRLTKLHDADAIQRTLSQPELGKWITFVGSNFHQGRALGLCTRALDGALTGKELMLVAETDEEFPTYMGSVGIHTIEADPTTAEVGYWVDRKFQGRGLGKTLLEAAIDIAFNEAGFINLEASAATDNLASLYLLKRFGFSDLRNEELETADGKLRPSLVLGLPNPVLTYEVA